MIEQIKAFAGEYRIAGVKTFNGMEGSGWEGQLFRGDKFIGLVGDDATGGPIHIHVRGEEHALLEAHSKKVTKSKYAPMECFLDDLVNYQLSVKRLQTQAKKIIIAIIEDAPECDKNGIPVAFNTFKVEYNPSTRAKVLAKYPNARIMNEALAAFEIPRAVRNPKV